ncbi:MAG TPA: DUF4232 domain-containing protein [Streptosporangiaceae bacterium]|jgi:hypothetical protein
MTSPAHLTRSLLAGAVLAGLAALAAGCGSTRAGAGPDGASGSSTPPSSTSPAASTASAASAPSTSSTSTTAGTQPTGIPVATCATKDLGIKIGASEGTAGSVYTTLDFTNLGTVTCTMFGYPGVSFGAGRPVKQVGLAAAENKSPPRVLVMLHPGQVANALLRVVDAGNFSASACGQTAATGLKIFPPNQTTPVYLPYSSQACSKPVQTLFVNVVQPGAGSA